MVDSLKVKVIYDDFVSKVNLTDEQVKILNMYINKDSRVKISMELGMCQRTVGYEIKKIKDLYNNYKDLELAKLKLLDK